MLESLLDGIEKPGRYIGAEINRYEKDFDKARVRFALAFPDVYEVGMSHLGLRLLYHLLNKREGVMADRVYTPWPDFEDRLRRNREPLRALESWRPLFDFDFVGFSLQYELSYTNILTMLDLAQIPFAAKDRTSNDPWIIAGGPCAFNPEPLADIFDIVVLGEAEEVLPELIGAFEVWRVAEGTRREFLEEARKIPGIYVPSFFDVFYDAAGLVTEIRPRYEDYPNVKKRLIQDLDESSPLPEKPLVPLLEIVHDRLGLEIARGCTRGCRFCQAGFIYRPVRERNPRTVLERAEEAIVGSGFEEVSLLSLSSGDYCQIQPLLSALMDRFESQKVAVSLPSMRVGTLTPELMEGIRRVRKTGFTLAPEAGSERLRRVINKGIRNEDLLSTAETSFRLGWRLLKLYFMMGLPTETREDLEALVERSLEVWHLAKSRKASINVSVSTFVPKPQTPFQWVGQLSRESTEENLSFLKDRLKRPGLRLKWSHPGQSVLEGVFARGDRRLGKVLKRAWELGARFDGWTEDFREDLWDRAFRETGLESFFYAERERTPNEILPWDHLSAGVEKDFLWKEYQRALAEQFTSDCRWNPCTQCGVCDHKTIRPRLYRDEMAFAPCSQESPRHSEQSTQLSFLYRLRYSKTDEARFFGQLEITRGLARAVCRSGLPAAYSQGFHPHVKLSFTEALPLGLESCAEEAYLTLTEKMDPQDVRSRLNRHLPKGFHIEEATEVPKRLSQSASHCVTYRIFQLPPLGVIHIMQNWLKHLDDPLVKKTKRGEVRLKLREVLLGVRQLDESSIEMDLYEGKGACFRPTPVLRHLLEKLSDKLSGYRICKIAVEPLEGNEDVFRTHYQCRFL